MPWYCSQVRAITYKNMNQSGKYNRTTRVYPDTGLCQHEPISYPGVSPTTPLIGKLSMHLRGPMNVSQMAVYKLPDHRLSTNGGPAAQKLRQQPRRRSNYKKYQSRKAQESPPLGLEQVKGSVQPQGTWMRRNQLPYCPRSTITTTLYVTGSTCSQTTSSTTCDTRGPFSPWSSPSPKPASLLIPALPPPIIPPLPSAIPAPPAFTATVHDTTTTCSETTSPTSSASRNESPVGSFSLNTETSSPRPSSTTLNSDESLAASTPCDTDTNSEAIHATKGPIKCGSVYNASTTAIVNDVSNAAAADTWGRVAFYSSEAPAEATGFAFLANLGDPQKSGTFDYAFGNSLGYVIADGSKVATDSTPFHGTLQTSERESAVFTDEICDGDCEYARPDTVAHCKLACCCEMIFSELMHD